MRNVKASPDLQGNLNKLKQLKQQTKKVCKVGFWSTAKYPDGTPVTNVALWNEYGTATGVPERPFFRQAIAQAEAPLLETVHAAYDPVTGLTTRDLARMGETMVRLIQDSIRKGDWSPNAPATVALKGSSQPLIDTGFMRRSVTYKVE